MEHTNYCRKLLLEIGKIANPTKAQELAMTLANVATKFQLPTNGNLLDDSDLRALPDELPLSLPFGVVALEVGGKGREIIFAQQFDDDLLVHVAHGSEIGWIVHATSWRIPRRDYMNRAEKGYLGFPGLRMHDSERGWLEDGDNYWFQRVLLGFLNALSCSNVRVARSEPKKSGKKIKSALPFDTYHVLTIDVPGKAGDSAMTGGHRSPREHLRRGHIRRLADSRRIWVNATVVAAGRGYGVVKKDYAVRCVA